MQRDSGSSAPEMRTNEAQDADEHANNLTNWQQEYDQLSGGGFYGRIDEVALDGLQLFKEHTNRSLRQQCNVWPDSVWLGIPARPSDCRINGLSVESNQLMCRPGNCDFELVTPEQFDIYGIVVKEDVLTHAADIQGIALKGLSFNEYPRLCIPQKTLQHVMYLLERILNHNACGLNSQLLQDLLTTGLLTLLQEEQPVAAQAPSYAHRKAVVDRVKDYIAAHPDVPVTMTELCELAHVSRRTLQYSFESILGISPLRFLRAARLNRVRRALSDAAEDRSVAVVAADWGFWHPGQFAKDYKQLFGENPSDTLKRAQRYNV
ncbi:MAG: helix-turn-helix domain-containing protein [Gammaproteobacteria bacterium]|nr:helix-turn-helix domain-containing protein [Gammaproteobacteria bacterium]